MKHNTLLLLFALSLAGCGHHTDEDDSDEESSRSSESSESSSEENESGCKYSDGTHSATVDYYNPETGHTATYELDVEVEDCEVTQINFPRGGWLDDSHISPTALDDDGQATIEDDEGRTFEVQIN